MKKKAVFSLLGQSDCLTLDEHLVKCEPEQLIYLHFD